MKPDFNYRANPRRSVSVFGTLSEQLVADVSGEILRLRSESPEPITLLINSNGGSTRCLEIIEGLLGTPDADENTPKLITVAIGNAGSAAATLLALGDYAIAYPTADVHFHGVRLSDAKEVTMERASNLAGWLRETNNATAIRLAKAFIKRLIFHYSRLKDGFNEERAASGNPILSEIECFALGLQKQLSPAGDRIVDKALHRWRSIERLSERVFQRLKEHSTSSVPEEEAAILKEIVEFEVQEHKGKDWSLNELGLAQVVEDYTILRDYHTGEHNELLSPLLEIFGPVFMTDEELVDYQGTEEKMQTGKLAKLAPRFQPFWYFTVSLCRHLQEAENPLTTLDAYWLGAVDEVLGSGLPCFRELAESDPDQLELGISGAKIN